MTTPFFSVIVPAYNSSSFIRRGLASVQDQSFRDFELIVVCDSCTDNTERIAQTYRARTDNVRYGLDGLTRDHGLRMATGKYVLFMDDDDWFLHEYCFQQLADTLAGNEVDVLAFGYIFRTKGYDRPTPQRLFTPRIDHVWSSCWRRDVIGDAHFGNARFCSDTYFLKAMRTRVNSYSLLDMPIYYYNFMRPGSQTDLFVKGIIKQSPVAE